MRLSKNQRRFAPIGGRFETELMAGFTGIPRRKLGDIVAAISVVGLGLFVLGEVTEIAFGDIKLVRRVEEAENTNVKDRIRGLLPLPSGENPST